MSEYILTTYKTNPILTEKATDNQKALISGLAIVAAFASFVFTTWADCHVWRWLITPTLHVPALSFASMVAVQTGIGCCFGISKGKGVKELVEKEITKRSWGEHMKLPLSATYNIIGYSILLPLCYMLAHYVH